MHPQLARLQHLTRRHFLTGCPLGLGAIALGSLLARDTQAAPGRVVNPLAPKPPHFAPRAKRVIYLHMSGAPPHLDLFDYKPELVKGNGKPCPDAFLKGKRFAFTSGPPKLLGTPRRFARHGKGGAWKRDERGVYVGRAASAAGGGVRAVRHPLDYHWSVQAWAAGSAAVHRLAAAGP